MNADPQTEAETILASLAHELNIDPLEIEEEYNSTTLTITTKTTPPKQKEIAISFHDEAPILILHMNIGFLPEEGRATVVEQLLEANLFWAGTRGATLGIDRESGIVIVARELPFFIAEGKLLDGTTLAAAINDMIEVTSRWCQIVIGETEVLYPTETFEAELTLEENLSELA